jgi:NAD(P)-dependent dehydrogenase (short-subunit alcohol dehydrogenase family)
MTISETANFYDFTGQVIVVTGGTGALGSEIACGLVDLGAKVAILGRNADAANKILDRMGSRRDSAKFFFCDVQEADSVKKASSDVLAFYGRVDALVNAAGGNNAKATTNPEQSFFDLSPEALRSVFNLNVLGTVLPSQIFGKLMAEEGRGSILNITSMAAVRPLTRVAAYSAAKAAVSNFTQWLAVHLAQECSPNLRVNAIAPGFFITEQNRFLLTDPRTGELTTRGKSILAHTPAGRFGTPEDLLSAVFWLLSPASSFVTGAVIPVDGGFGAYSGV